MATTEKYITLLKNNDQEALMELYKKDNWGRDVDFELVYNEVKDIENESIRYLLWYMYEMSK